MEVARTLVWGDYAVIVIYMVVVLALGAWFARGEKNAGDFLLGGRALPPWAVGLSCMMSVVSSVSMVTVTGEVFNNSLSLYAFSLLTPLLAIPFFFLFTLFYFRLGSFTPYEYLEYRYSPAIRGLVAISSLYGRIFYLGSVLFTTAKIFEGAYEWPPTVTILVVGVVGAAYTVMGGMKAVVWTDVIQFFVLLAGFVIVIYALCTRIDGGFFGALECAQENGRFFNKFGEGEFYKITPYVRLSFWLMLINFVTSQLSIAASDQITIQRFLSTRNWRAAFRARLVASFSTYPYTLAIFFIGLAVFAFYHQNPDPGVHSGDGAFFHFVATQLPTPVPGLFMAAMLAAIMSTLDSGMNSMATVYLKEIHQLYINRNLTGEQEVSISRWATFAVGVVAIALGLGLEYAGQWLGATAAEVGTLFALLGEATLPAFLFAVLSKRANSMLIWFLTAYGFGTTFVHKFWYAASTAATINWQPGEPLGWGGPISYAWPLTALAVALLAAAAALYARRRNRRLEMIALSMFAALAAGGCEVFATWALFSNFCITDVPLARSFAFGLPTVLIIGWIALYFCPKQPREKYQGLTIFTLNQPMLNVKEREVQAQ